VSASVRALASPASLKGVLTPMEAAALLAAGLSRVDGVEVDEAPVADGGEGTAEVLFASLGGDWRTAVVSDPLGRPVGARWLRLPDGTAVVEAAEAIGLPRLKPEERNPLAASSWGLGELLVATLTEQPTSLLVCVGGTATVDGGAAMLAVVGSWLRDIPIRVACDVRNPLLGPEGAAHVFGPQKGADEDAIEELEDRLSRIDRLQPYRDLPGAGAGGGLGAAFASLGGELLDGADLVLRLIRFDERASGAALVVSGEGTVDATTFNGKAPGAVRKRCAQLGVRCELFGGVVRDGFAARALSGDPSLAAEDLVQLGEELALTLVSGHEPC
jgi:glycerate kinase